MMQTSEIRAEPRDRTNAATCAGLLALVFISGSLSYENPIYPWLLTAGATFLLVDYLRMISKEKLLRPLHKNLYDVYFNGGFPFYEPYDPKKTSLEDLLTHEAYFWYPGNLWRWAFVYRSNYAERIYEFWSDEIYNAQLKEYFHQLPRISDVPVDGTRAPVISEREVRRIHRSYLKKNQSKIIWLNIRTEFMRIHLKPLNQER